MRLQTRDKKILDYMRQFRCLTTAQTATLFIMNLKVCQRRLRALCKGGYLDKRPIPSTTGHSPNLFYLGKEGLSLLKVRALRPRFGLLFSHQMKNSDLLINVFNAFRDSFIKVSILPEHLIKKAQLDVIPDGAFSLTKNKKNVLFLLENDSTETEITKSSLYHMDIETKVMRYIDLFRSNDVEFYNNYFKCKFQRFRVLVIVSTQKRFKAVKSLVKEYDEHGFAWITTLEKFSKNPCGNIWQVQATEKADLSIV